MGCLGKHKMSKSVGHLHSQYDTCILSAGMPGVFYFPLFPRPQHPNASHWGPFRDTPHLRHHQRAHQPETGPNHRSWKYLQKKCGQFHNFGPPQFFGHCHIVMFPKDRQTWGPWMFKCSGNFLKTLKWPGQKVILSLGIYVNVQFIHFNKNHEVW